MTGRRFRWLGCGLLASAGAALLSLTSMMTPGFAFGTIDVYTMGGSGMPIPTQSYLAEVTNVYFPAAGYPLPHPISLFTPEGLYPLTAIKDLPLDISVSRGVTILNEVLQGSPGVGAFGYSQSAVIASLEMEQLDPTGTPMPSAQIFLLIGDPMNPNGGVLERFADLTLPSLGLNFYGATPADDFTTAIYTLEYDGYADFPQYPLDLPADFNAVAGILFVHGMYPNLTAAEVDGATPLTNTEGPTLTHYFMIPVQNLPILDPLRSIPFVGNPLADLMQPDLKVIVNLGYGSIADGWSPGPPNVPTPFGLLPTNVSPVAVFDALGAGTQQGINAFATDVSSGINALLTAIGNGTWPSLLGLSGGPASAPLTFPTSGPTTPAALIDSVIEAIKAANTNIATAITDVIGSGYGVLVPTADVANAVVIGMPSYDFSLVLGGIKQAVDGEPVQGLVDAVSYPIAANTALGTLAEGFELEVLANLIP